MAFVVATFVLTQKGKFAIVPSTKSKVLPTKLNQLLNHCLVPEKRTPVHDPIHLLSS
jgi:hypothetical protein